MKPTLSQQSAIVLAALAVTVGAGCSSTPNNTQKGAAGGAALGALAGANIGNNRGSGNAASGAAIGAAAGAIAGGAIGHNQDRRAASSNGTGYADAAVTNIYVNGQPPMPPAPIAESISPQPASNAVWIPGYWSYDNGNRYVWVAGHWEIPPQGAVSYQPPEWRRQGNGFVYVRGYWR
jgi:phage tail tape-measure protein